MAERSPFLAFSVTCLPKVTSVCQLLVHDKLLANCRLSANSCLSDGVLLGKIARLGASQSACVSTYGQTLDAQLEQLKQTGCARIYREKVTGARADSGNCVGKMIKLAFPG